MFNASSETSSASRKREHQKPARKKIPSHICSICLESCNDLSKVGVMTCGHFYHSDCIQNWLRRSPSCPTCQRKGYLIQKLYVTSDGEPSSGVVPEEEYITLEERLKSLESHTNSIEGRSTAMEGQLIASVKAQSAAEMTLKGLAQDYEKALDRIVMLESMLSAQSSGINAAEPNTGESDAGLRAPNSASDDPDMAMIFGPVRTGLSPEQCANYLKYILERKIERSQADRIGVLVQQLVDAHITAEKFFTALEGIAGFKHPQQFPLLQDNLDALRQRLFEGTLTIKGIKPPPSSALNRAAAGGSRRDRNDDVMSSDNTGSTALARSASEAGLVQPQLMELQEEQEEPTSQPNSQSSRCSCCDQEHFHSGSENSSQSSETLEAKRRLARNAALTHAFDCLVKNCRKESCRAFKGIHQHSLSCTVQVETGNCRICSRFISICCDHAQSCQRNGRCPVPHCFEFRNAFRPRQAPTPPPRRARENNSTTSDEAPEGTPAVPLIRSSTIPLLSGEASNIGTSRPQNGVNLSTSTSSSSVAISQGLTVREGVIMKTSRSYVDIFRERVQDNRKATSEQQPVADGSPPAPVILTRRNPAGGLGLQSGLRSACAGASAVASRSFWTQRSVDRPNPAVSPGENQITLSLGGREREQNRNTSPRRILTARRRLPRPQYPPLFPISSPNTDAPTCPPVSASAYSAAATNPTAAAAASSTAAPDQGGRMRMSPVSPPIVSSCGDGAFTNAPAASSRSASSDLTSALQRSAISALEQSAILALESSAMRRQGKPVAIVPFHRRFLSRTGEDSIGPPVLTPTPPRDREQPEATSP